MLQKNSTRRLLLTVLMAAVFGLIAVRPAAAYLSVRVQGQAVYIENAAPVAFLVLLVSRDAHGRFIAGETVRVPAGASVRASRVPSVNPRVEMAQPLLLSAPLKASPNCAVMTFVDLHALTEAARQVKGLAPSETPEAAAQLAAARQLARLEVQAYVDEARFGRSNAYAEEARAKWYESDPVAAAKNDIKNKNAAMFDSMIARSSANYRVLHTYLGQLEKERDLLKGPAAEAATARKTLVAEQQLLSMELAAGQEFLRALAAWREAEPASSPSMIPIGWNRACGNSPLLREYIEVRFQSPQGAGTVVAEVQFDRGGTQRTVLTQVGNTATWRGPIMWPLDAAVASAYIVTPARIAVPGQITPGRASLTMIARQADSQLQKIEKAYKAAKDAADGGQQPKTFIIR